jgi:hypothetical protein
MVEDLSSDNKYHVNSESIGLRNWSILHSWFMDDDSEFPKKRKKYECRPNKLFAIVIEYRIIDRPDDKELLLCIDERYGKRESYTALEELYEDNAVNCQFKMDDF